MYRRTELNNKMKGIIPTLCLVACSSGQAFLVRRTASFRPKSPALRSEPNESAASPPPSPQPVELSEKKASRFSKFAPDANELDAEEFRAQLKENMKADLEKRRATDPSRGNQPTKSYLDNL
jgi:hypothetical protein